MDETTLLLPVQQRMAALMDRAIDTLEALLDDPNLPAEQRANVALRLLDLAVAGEADGPRAAPANVPMPPRYFAIPDFFSSDLYAAAIDTALRSQDRFVASAVTNAEAGYRRSRVLYEDSLPTLYEAMQQQIIAALPAVCTALLLPAFEPSRVEVHMTVHGDGDYFRLHHDAGAPEIERRVVSFAWYFMLRQPCGFSGGALRLYETIGTDPPQHDPARFQDVMPVDNMIVFFESRLMHEVLPLHVPSGRFEDGRFTLNGWLQR